MGKSIAEVRRINRERRARQRAALRDAGVPTAARVNAAVVEAQAFAMRIGIRRPGVNIEQTGAHLWIDTALVIDKAVEILVDRQRFDRKHSQRAVAAVLSPRPEHLWPSYVPTHHVAPAPGSPSVD